MVLLGISGIYNIYGLNALIYISHAITFKPNVHQKKKVFPEASRLVVRIFSSNSGPGSYSRQRLAGKMCLFRSYHRLSTTLVKDGSLSAPSNWLLSGRDKGSSVEGAGGGLLE